MSNIGYRNLSVGDKVRLVEPPERINIAVGSSFSAKPKVFAEIEVAKVHTDYNGSIYAIEDTEGTMYGGANPYEVDVISYGNHLPNADYIAWLDWDHNKNVAYRDGHPGNNVWVYNGQRLSGEDLAAIVGTHPISILELQEV